MIILTFVNGVLDINILNTAIVVCAVTFIGGAAYAVVMLGLGFISAAVLR